MNVEKILILADDSAASVGAIQYGFMLAQEFGSKVALLCVVEPGSAIGNVDAGIFPDDALMLKKKKTMDFLNRMKSEYGKGTAAELMMPEGDVVTVVLKTINEWNADLIVTGTHGRKGLSKLFAGSIAEAILHRSPVPVCVVPMKKH